MKDTIYLTISKSRGCHTMRKTFSGTVKGEICVKLNIQVPDDAFAPPILEQSIVIADWRQGIDIEDVKFDQNIITEEEAGLIREKRLAKMKEILESQGYSIEKVETEQES